MVWVLQIMALKYSIDQRTSPTFEKTLHKFHLGRHEVDVGKVVVAVHHDCHNPERLTIDSTVARMDDGRAVQPIAKYTVFLKR